MKKLLFKVWIVSLFFASFLAQAGPKSYIYVINKTGKDLVRGEVERIEGQKYAPKVRRKLGAPKELKGYTCKGLYCKADVRKVFWEKEPVKFSTDEVLIKNGATVKIAQIDRSEVHLGLKTFKKTSKDRIPNLDSKRFKTVLGPYSVFPFDQVLTTLKTTDDTGKIDLVISSERIGLSARDYAKSIALGSVGALGGSLVPVGAGLGIVGGAANLGSVLKNKAQSSLFSLTNNVRILESKIRNFSGSSFLAISKLKSQLEAAKSNLKIAQNLIARGASGTAKLAARWIAIPIMIIGTVIAVGIATISTIASLTVKAQKSGLTVLPFIDGGYRITQYLQERKGSRFPDMYITIWPK